MLVLSIDTSGKNGSLALVRCADAGCETLAARALTGGSYSAELVPSISAILAENHVTRNSIDGFAVAAGPGSFTGLRVGLSTVKALAEILRKPVAALSVLQALAAQSPIPGRVLAAVDDHRGHIYSGEYMVSENALPAMHEEALLTADEFLARAQGATVVCADGRLAQALAARGLRVAPVERPTAEFMARLGYAKMVAGESSPPEVLDANYIRRSDAELFGKPSY